MNKLYILAATFLSISLDCAAPDGDNEPTLIEASASTTREAVPAEYRVGLTDDQVVKLQSRHGHVYGAATDEQVKVFSDKIQNYYSAIYGLSQALRGRGVFEEVRWDCAPSSTDFSQADQAVMAKFGDAKATDACTALTDTRGKFEEFLTRNKDTLDGFAKELAEINKGMLPAARIYREAGQ